MSRGAANLSQQTPYKTEFQSGITKGIIFQGRVRGWVKLQPPIDIMLTFFKTRGRAISEFGQNSKGVSQ